MRRSVLIVLTIVYIMVFGVSAAVSHAADKDKAALATAEKATADKAADEKPAAEKRAKAKKAAKKPSGQLPPYFSSVINDDQRDKVVSTYGKFNTKLGKLKDEIKTVTADRDKALEDLLTDEQKTKLAQLKADAKAKRAKPEK